VNPVVAYPDETLRGVVYRMAQTGATHLLVVDRDDPGKLLGQIGLNDLLKGRARHLEEERRRDRVIPLHALLPKWMLPERVEEAREPPGGART
jgi:CBS domain-containing protein